MKKVFLLGSVFIATTVFAAVWMSYTASDEGSSITFKIKNFGLTVNGSFKGLAATLQFDPQQLTAASIDASVDANTVNTSNNMRDNHLRKEEYFDVAKYPRIKLVSSKIVNTGQANAYTFTGKLTIKKVTKDISFPFTAVLAANGTYSLKGEFKVNRRDFGVGGSSISMADVLIVNLNVTAKKK
jgi:polyisoprenoid-binding protein YceI